MGGHPGRERSFPDASRPPIALRSNNPGPGKPLQNLISQCQEIGLSKVRNKKFIYRLSESNVITIRESSKKLKSLKAAHKKE
jgi:hypothetical protein